MADLADNLHQLSFEDRAALEARLLQFDQTWTPDALQPGTLDRQLRGLPATDPHFQLVALLELVKIDMEHWWTAGREQTVESYLQRFPQLGEQEFSLQSLIVAECQIRFQHDSQRNLDNVDLEQIRLRFPSQWEHVRPFIEGLRQSSVQSAPHPSHANSDTSQPGREIDTTSDRHALKSVLPEQFGRYRIIRPLGAGAMGAVYLAHDTQLDREIALKTPSFGGDPDPELIKRFYREARSAANLRHPNICPVHDVGELNSVHYITMAYIEGRPLSAFIRSGKPVPQRSAAVIVRKLALALAHAHQQGVIHRDLKPANIMVDVNREPIVMDFGLARRDDSSEQSRMTQSGMILGTPAYMSPEQVEGDPQQIGPASDQYSLGIILYELLTTALPFRGSVAAVIGRIMTQEPDLPRNIRADIDLQLEAICLKMISKKAGDRYGSMKDVASALAGFISAGPDSAHQPARQVPGAVPDSIHAARLGETPQVESPRDSKQPRSAQPLETPAHDPAVDPQLAQFLQTRSGGRGSTVTPQYGPDSGTRRDSSTSGRGAAQKPMWRLADTTASWLQAISSTYRNLPPAVKWTAIGSLAGLLLLLGVIVLLNTPGGTLRLEIDDGLQVSFDEGQIVVTSADDLVPLHPGVHDFEVIVAETRIPVGESINLTTGEFQGQYQVAVHLGDVKLTANQLDFTKGDQTVLRVQLLPATIVSPDLSHQFHVESLTRIGEHGGRDASQTFPDLITHRGHLVCAFRESTASGPGILRILRSADGKRWTSAAMIQGQVTGIDFSLPELTVMPDGRLMLIASGIIAGQSNADKNVRSYVMFSSDAIDWTSPQEIRTGVRGERLGQVDWHNGSGYAVGYQETNGTTTNSNISLYRTTDGIEFSQVKRLNVTGLPSETALRILPQGKMILLVRRDGENRGMWIGSSWAPFTVWQWVDTGIRCHGPSLLRLPDGRIWATVREFSGEETARSPARTVVARVTEDTFEWILQLAGGGDTGDAGMAWKDNRLWIAYHSSHEGDTGIYLQVVNANSSSATEPEADDWINLFDGTSLDQWRGYHQPDVGSAWRIESGHLVLDTDAGGQGGDIVTRRTFHDFELEFEWMIEQRGNSGVLYRVPMGELQTFHSGLEYQLLDNERYQNLSRNAVTGAIYGLYPANDGVAPFPFGQFNQSKILVQNNQIEHWLNGECVVRTEFGTPEWNRRRDTSMFRDNPQHGLNQVGRIALQDHKSKVWFRRIRIRELPSQ